MPKRDFPDELRDELTAYLDNEAAPEVRRRIEVRLKRDPAFRAEAETLKAAWKLLDDLPRADPSPNLTSRTLRQITVIQPSIAPNARMATWLHRFPWWTVAMILVAFMFGWLAAGLVSWRRDLPTSAVDDPLLVRELRLIDGVPLYSKVESLEFLQSLDHPDRFGADAAGP